MNQYVVFLFLLFVTSYSISAMNKVSDTFTDTNLLSKKFLKTHSLNLNRKLLEKFQSTTSFYGNSRYSLFIQSPASKSALINLKIKNTIQLISIGIHNKQFVIMSQNEKKIFSVESKEAKIYANSFMTNSLSSNGAVKFNDVNQWKMVKNDYFGKNMTSLEWNHDIITECSVHKMLGGHCQVSNKELIKEYKNLPPHTMVRIEANYHFMGRWDSNSGYLKVDGMENAEKKVLGDGQNYVWAQRCKNEKSKSNINFCNNLQVCKMISPIKSTISHKNSSIKLIFGSTLKGNACDQSYGISDVKIFIR